MSAQLIIILSVPSELIFLIFKLNYYQLHAELEFVFIVAFFLNQLCFAFMNASSLEINIKFQRTQWRHGYTVIDKKNRPRF